MKNSRNDTLYFGDLHFHTHYSDNRDHASIEDMILAGTQHRLSIFGTADHNHNLDARKWQQTLDETTLLSEKYPDLLILNNCEITFLLGHLNVLLPEHIDGTIEEGYRYLYQDPNALKIINHPFPSDDEWHQRIIPDAIGVEVINGSIFARAMKKPGYSLQTAIDIPSIQTYATYLALGIPVAALGASDAHQKDRIGFGMTGFWLVQEPDNQAVIDAIKEHRTFASTTSNITLDWEYHEASAEISWQICRNNSSSSTHAVTVEIYHGNRKIHTTHGNGTCSVDLAGFYWIAGFDRQDIVISSPIQVTHPFPEETSSSTILQQALHSIHQDVTCLTLTDDQVRSQQTTMVTLPQPVELQMIADTDAPHIVDAFDKRVQYEVIRREKPRVIIDKVCDAGRFEEFYLWLDRNEIHEYVFASIQYQIINHTLCFTGYLLPQKMVRREGIQTCYQKDIDPLKHLVKTHSDIKVYVSTLPQLTIKIQQKTLSFPLSMVDAHSDFSSIFYYDEDETTHCPQHLLGRLQQEQSIARLPLHKRIYQFFM